MEYFMERSTPYNISEYQFPRANSEALINHLIKQTAPEITDEPRLNRRQKIQIRDGLESAGTQTSQHPLHLLYQALKTELMPDAPFREASLSDFEKRYTEVGDVEGQKFLQIIQDKTSDLHEQGLAKSIEETAEKAEDRLRTIAIYVAENYQIPL
jgi:hypothetical protein